jgi:hypothetical protein
MKPSRAVEPGVGHARGMRSKSWFLLPLTSALPGLVPAVAGANPDQPRYRPKVAIEAARATALRQVPGAILEEELEREQGTWVYEFEIRPEEGQAARPKEVLVDADSGELVAIEDED